MKNIKKTLNLIALTVFMGANLFTQISYAVDDLKSVVETIQTETVSEESNIKIQWDEQTVAKLVKWERFNVTLKKLFRQNASYYTDDNNIKSIVRATEYPWSWLEIQSSDSQYPIYVWSGWEWVVYYYTEADKIELNPNSRFMFFWMKTLLNLDLRDWDTSAVTDMTEMFRDATINWDLDLSNWDISNVTNMKAMFEEAEINSDMMWLSSWDTSAVTDMSYLFYWAEINSDMMWLSGWNTSAVADMSNMFEEAEINSDMMWLSGWDLSALENMRNMFSKTKINSDMIWLSGWDTSDITNMSYLFSEAKINWDMMRVSSWDTSSVTDMSYLFYWTKISWDMMWLSNWDTSSVTNMSNMFYEATINWDVMWLSNWDTSSVTNMSNMFYEATINWDLDLSSWDIRAVINMNNMLGMRMFWDLNLSNWNTSGITNMSNMFYDVKIYWDLDLSNWDTSAVTDMSDMFNFVMINWDLDLSNWNTSAVTDMSDMFNFVMINWDLDLSNWDTSAVTDMSDMFSMAIINWDLELSNWDISSVTNMGEMFASTRINWYLNLGGRHNTSKWNSVFSGNEWGQIIDTFFNVIANQIYVSRNFADGISFDDNPFPIGWDEEEITIWEGYGYGWESNVEQNLIFSSWVYGSNWTYCNWETSPNYFRIDGDEWEQWCFSEVSSCEFIYDWNEEIINNGGRKTFQRYSIPNGHNCKEVTATCYNGTMKVNKREETEYLYWFSSCPFDTHSDQGQSYSWWWGWWGWWGGWWSNKSDTPKDEKKSDDTLDKISQNDNSVSSWMNVNYPENVTPDNSTTEISEQGNGGVKASDNSYTNEQKEAYEFAKENWITTMSTIEKADMSWKLTRIQMAKMLSQYAINVLWQTPDTSKVVKFKDVTSKKDADYDNWVTLAYQLWIMWQNMPWNNFRPNDEVTRAEFITALSRLLYNTSDGEYKSTSKYYTHHMEKLKDEWIVTNTDPSMKERRWYVMIMLMRSVK